ncbi:MAG: GNAT family N-acetyltransferase, partial [Huintestinicola sp.]
MIREAGYSDLEGLLELYTYLHDNPIPEKDKGLVELWDRIMNDGDHHIIVAEEDGVIVSSCVCVIIPNLTHSQQPYAFVENVVTRPDHRKRGLATACLDFARGIAENE